MENKNNIVIDEKISDVSYHIRKREGDPINKIYLSIGKSELSNGGIAIWIDKESILDKKSIYELFSRIREKLNQNGIEFTKCEIFVVKDEVSQYICEYLKNCKISAELLTKKTIESNKTTEEVKEEIETKFKIEFIDNNFIHVKGDSLYSDMVMRITPLEFYSEYKEIIEKEPHLEDKINSMSPEDRTRFIVETISNKTSIYTTKQLESRRNAPTATSNKGISDGVMAASTYGDLVAPEMGVAIHDPNSKNTHTATVTKYDENGDVVTVAADAQSIGLTAGGVQYSNDNVVITDYTSEVEQIDREGEKQYYIEGNTIYDVNDRVIGVIGPGFKTNENNMLVKINENNEEVIIGAVSTKEDIYRSREGSQKHVTKTLKPNPNNNQNGSTGFINMSTLIGIVMSILVLSLVVFGFIVTKLR